MRIIEISEFVQDSLEHVLSWTLAAVDSTCQENNWLICQVGILGGKGDLVHRPSLNTMDQSLFVKINKIVSQTFILHLFNRVFNIIFIEWECIGEK